MASTNLTFASRDAHREWLETQAVLPQGFKVGTARFEFTPQEVSARAAMTVTLLALDQASSAFGAVFTKNAFPGAPVLLGRRRLDEPILRAVVINNKIANVCAPGGLSHAERICAAVGEALGCDASEVMACSTGVIGWQLPVSDIASHVPAAARALSGRSALAAAEGICTTDLYPKVRRAAVGAGSIVGIAKGAGMIEPNLATMLVYLMTDVAIPRDVLRGTLQRVVRSTFNTISVDSDTSTSDTVALLSSGVVPCADHAAFEAALHRVCADLSEDIVRNGEGVHHVVRVSVEGAPSVAVARAVGKSVVNSPLFQCAIAGNDPNVGRLVCAVGKYLGAHDLPVNPLRCRMSVGGIEVLAGGEFRLDPAKEKRLSSYLKQCELYASAVPEDGLTFRPPIAYPPHERLVEVAIELGMGDRAASVIGADRTHEYISENADYRS